MGKTAGSPSILVMYPFSNPTALSALLGSVETPKNVTSKLLGDLIVTSLFPVS